MDTVITNIIFTKNRPLQFEAYLRSLYRFFGQAAFKSVVLYKKELFNEQYEQLFGKYTDLQVIREKDFHSDLLKAIEETNTKYILFGIDDLAYFDSVDLSLIDKIFEENNDIFGFSLRFGENIKAGPDNINNISIEHQEFYSVDWTKGKTPNSKYPFELCATIYKTELVKQLIKGTMCQSPFLHRLLCPSSKLVSVLPKQIKRKVLKGLGFFFNPNTFESWVCKWAQRNKKGLPQRLYFQKLCASAIQVNRVNTSTGDISEGEKENTVEVLNEEFKKGHRFDIEWLIKNKPVDTHSGSKNFKIARDTF